MWPCPTYLPTLPPKTFPISPGLKLLLLVTPLDSNVVSRRPLFKYTNVA